MFHEPPRNFLYSAYFIEAAFTGGDGTVVSGTGTGFVLDAGLPTALIVTNRHVVDRSYRDHRRKYVGFERTMLKLTGRRADDSLYEFEIHPSAKVHYHRNQENDVALIECRVNRNDPDPIHWHFGLDHLADSDVYESLAPFDLICYSGFPEQHDKRTLRPILRTGRIASDPRHTYSWDHSDHGDCVAYEGFSSEGASGSPVFAPPRGASGIPDSRHGYLIGVNAGHVLQQYGHSGISYFYKSTVILEMVLAVKSVVAAPRDNG
jgi:hypothetical protein